MWNPIKNHKLRKDWRLVSTLPAYFSTVDDDGKETSKDMVFYYLYENGLGKRKCKCAGAGYYSGDSDYKIGRRRSHPYYLGKIHPWVEGQFNPDIPSYDSIKQKEFKDALAGKIT